VKEPLGQRPERALCGEPGAPAHRPGPAEEAPGNSPRPLLGPLLLERTDYQNLLPGV